MPIFTFRPPVAVSDPARVDAWLAAHGYVLEDGSSIHADGSISVNVDRDPSADVAAIVNVPTPGQQARLDARAAIAAYLQASALVPPASRTPEQRVLTALLTLVKDTLAP